MLDQLIAMVVVGAVVGALARLFLKGDQRISILWTIDRKSTRLNSSHGRRPLMPSSA